MKTEKVTEDCLLSQVMDNYFAILPVGEVSRLFKEREIRVNGVKTGDRKQFVQAGSEVTVYEKSGKEKQIFLPVYEDEEWLVVDKEQGVNSEGLFHELQKTQTVYFIHRLDRNTAGLMVFAKTKQAERFLREAFEKRTALKTYHALCVGTPKPLSLRAQAYLKKDAQKSVVRIFDKPTAGAERIVTGYQTEQTNGKFSLLSVHLITGKTHQIRAHLAHLGIPILGDEKYGNERVNDEYHVKKQQLLAKKLTIADKTFVSQRELPLCETERSLLSERKE